MLGKVLSRIDLTQSLSPGCPSSKNFRLAVIFGKVFSIVVIDEFMPGIKVVVSLILLTLLAMSF